MEYFDNISKNELDLSALKEDIQSKSALYSPFYKLILILRYLIDQNISIYNPSDL